MQLPVEIVKHVCDAAGVPIPGLLVCPPVLFYKQNKKKFVYSTDEKLFLHVMILHFRGISDFEKSEISWMNLWMLLWNSQR